MESLDDDVARFRSAAATLSARDIAHLDAAGAAAAHRELRTACDLVLAFAARLLSKVEEDGRWASSGARTFPEWVARQRGGSVGMARAEATLGKALTDDLPDARRAVSEGGITLEHVEVLARFGPTSDARRAALRSDLPDRNEAALVAKAAGMGVDDFRRELKRWAMRVDEASAEREHSAAQAKEYLSLARRPDGVSIQGFLTVEHGDVLATALRAVIGVPAQDDARTPEQRRAAALTDVSVWCSTRDWPVVGARFARTSASTSRGTRSHGWPSRAPRDRSRRTPAAVRLSLPPSSTTESRSRRPSLRGSPATAR